MTKPVVKVGIKALKIKETTTGTVRGTINIVIDDKTPMTTLTDTLSAKLFMSLNGTFLWSSLKYLRLIKAPQ